MFVYGSIPVDCSRLTLPVYYSSPPVSFFTAKAWDPQGNTVYGLPFRE